MRLASAKPGEARLLRSGFTLLELMAAIALAGFALLSARRLLEQLADARDRLSVERTRIAESRNGVRLLRALVDRAEVGVDSFVNFRGGPVEASFLSRCDASGGWVEPCHVTIGIANAGDSALVVVNVEGQTAVDALRWKSGATFRYLEATTAARAWREAWTVGIVLPAAIAVVSASDTLVFRVGGRS